MDDRSTLHELLKVIIDSNNVYYQPPETLKLKYPCFIYEKDNYYAVKADNIFYTGKPRYLITYVDNRPDTLDFMKLLAIPYCKFNRRYVSDNLYHDVYEIYF